jgi:hypothetical protein
MEVESAQLPVLPVAAMAFEDVFEGSRLEIGLFMPPTGLARPEVTDPDVM